MRKSISLIVLILIFMSGITCKDTAQELFEKGHEAHKAKNYNEAIKWYKKSMSINHDNVSAHYNLGIIYNEKGLVDEAISEYKGAIAIDSNFWQAHYNLGIIYDKKGMVDKALSEYEKTVAINPNHAEAHNNLGVTYARKDMLDESISEYKKAIAIDPNNALVHSNLAAEYEGKGHNSLAADYFYKAGLLYLKQGDRETAINAYLSLKRNKSKKSEELERDLYEKLYPELKQKRSEPSK